ncbi:MAG: chromosomal replication initiator protein DnaA [Erysipelotrichaceae bacterium]|nr:chromosomal replication initiator protein DnaA [Erysipelotrichaceae bacterium]MDD3810129.1 chromosomal replication initiator protein DnaA [Erysipelotrichaceae bacterium]
MNDYDKIWHLCLDELEHSIDDQPEEKIIFDSYLRTASIVAIDNNIVTITHRFNMVIHNILKYSDQIETILSRLLSTNIALKVMSSDDYTKLQNNEVFESNINPELTFDNFVVGSSNQFAQNAALHVALNPGSTFNPLFIYSNPGLGKTHLLHAIGNFAYSKNSDLKIRYITSKEFVDEVVNSIKNKKSDELLSRYKKINILLIDDIQFLFNKDKSSEMFFHIFNDLIANNRQIVITSDKMPDELNGIEDRLISRFKSGLSYGIEPPNFDTARAILKKKIDNLENSQIQISDDVVDFMVTNYGRDIRNLEGALKRLFFVSIIYHADKINMDLALEAFKDDKVTISATKRELSSESILKTTAEYYNLLTSQVISKNKKRMLTIPREMGMYLMREQLDLTFVEIGLIYSGRDHSTVMKACKRVETKLKKDVEYKKALNQIKERLGVL